ncbi:cellulose-growth-specific protein [Colletotrichum cuscutae]|uniref:lytic cellulose monooxygenase (C4-dehydrogenating) n=1 Tax=Colletotrichum cuscutae TaxID=1209917 RepID=A0AAI9V2Q1_9PEZI|nr:cellulose-growth-specific protein [Colletotrichum cuscutae]
MKSSIASLLGSAALVAAHGYVSDGLIGGTNYTFYQPYQDPYTSPAPERISRPIQGNGPVEDLTSIDLQCGGYTAGGVKGSSPAKLVAEAKAGDEVTLNWTLWPESHIGPTITYMAKCAGDDCTTFTPNTDKVWFKVQESGREGTSNTWGATPLMTAGNSGVKYTIPECLAPGQYLVRHEIIALHASYSYPGAHAAATVPTLAADEEEDCPAESEVPTATATAAPVATPTQAADDEEDCPAESEAPVATSTAAAPVAAPTQAASDDEEDCPAESSAPVATPTPTQAADDEEDCPVETPSATAVAKRMSIHDRRIQA